MLKRIIFYFLLFVNKKMIGFPTSLPRHSLNEKSISRLRNHEIYISLVCVPHMAPPAGLEPANRQSRNLMPYPFWLRRLIYYLFSYSILVFIICQEFSFPTTTFFLLVVSLSPSVSKMCGSERL